MKSIKQIALSFALTLGAFGAVTYTACNKDECKDVTCQNGGTCSDGKCNCPSGFEGSNCETQSRNRFLNNGAVATFVVGAGQDECYNPGYNMTITPGSNPDEITITNFAGYGNSAVVSGIKVDGTTFSKTGTVTVGSVTLSNIEGTIKADGSEIEFDYRAVDDDNTLDCHAKGTKQ